MPGWTHDQQSRHKRGYGSKWIKLREIIKRRDGGLCQPCLKAGKVTPYAAVDHITPKSQGGSDDPSNLQCVCGPCHAAKTQQEAARASGVTLRQRAEFDAHGRVIWPDGG